jgi:hypothetical protein
LAFQLELIQSDYQAIYSAAHQVIQGIGFVRFGLRKAFKGAFSRALLCPIPFRATMAKSDIIERIRHIRALKQPASAHIVSAPEF